MPYARGKYAFEFCDYCGFRYPYGELKKLVVNQQITSMKVCPECWVPDQPQLWVGRTPVYDPQTLYDPRIDQTIPSTWPFFGWNPVGDPVTMDLTLEQGVVTVEIT